MNSIKSSLQRFTKSTAFAGFIMFLIALVLNIALQSQSSTSFFSLTSINTLFAKNVPFILVCISQSLLLISGTMDISCGIQLALVNVVIIMCGQELGLPFPVCCLLGICAAVLASILCWVCCAVIRLPALLASYALTFVIKGVNVLIMSVPQGKVEKVWYKGYDSLLFGFLPVSALALIGVLLVWLYVKRTRFGTDIYAVGGNPRNAFAAGISPTKVQFRAFLFKGIIVGIAGICLTLMIASGNPLQAEDYGIRSLSACIFGGLNFGGAGSVAGAVFGGGFFVLIQNSVYYFFLLLGKLIPGFSVTSYWQNFVSDIIIFLGLLMTIVTSMSQRRALRQGIIKQFKRAEKYTVESVVSTEGGGGSDE